MSLTATNALLSITDGAGAVLQPANGAVAQITPGQTLTFALVSTSGVMRWTLQFIAPAYPALHLRTFDWVQGQFNGIAIPMPALPVTGVSPLSGVEVISTVSDGSGGAIPSVINFLQTRGGSPSPIPMQSFADYVIVAALPAYTNVGGVLTGNSNGAVTSTMADGATPAVGDVFLLEQGLAGSAADAGLYQLTAVGAAGAKFVATAIGFGQIMMPKAEVLIGPAGTVFKNTTWVNTLTGKSNLIGTASFTFFPRQVTWTSALVAGVVTGGASNTTGAPAVMSILSATLTQVVAIRRTANTTTATVNGYAYNGNPTAGGLGTGSASMMACVAAGTVNNADVSTMDVTVINPC